MSDYFKPCRICKQQKPLSEFYDASGTRDGKLHMCKECAKAYYHSRKANAKTKRSTRSGRIEEQTVIDKLMSMGIYAAAGSATQFSWVDVVAWGCVRIEVKSSANRSGKYSFFFTAKQRSLGIRGDFVLLVLLTNQDDPSYHLVPSKHPVFYYTDGRLKTGIGYQPNCQSRKHRENYESLTDETMEQYRDAWHLIEQRRLEIVKELLLPKSN